MTCRIVKAPTDIPTIMEILVVGPLARNLVSNYSRDLQRAKWAQRSICAAKILKGVCLRWVNIGNSAMSA